MGFLAVPQDKDVTYQLIEKHKICSGMMSHWAFDNLLEEVFS